MESVLDQLPPGSRVAVVRLRSLGDCVLTTPALALLHGCRPDLEIGVIVEEPFAPVFQHNPCVRAVLPARAATLLRWRPRLVLNYHGGTRSMVLTAACWPALRAGFAHHPGSWIYSVRIPRAQEILGVDRTVHTAEHLASAMFHLGVPPAEVPRASLYAPPPAQDGDYAVLHPFASSAEKTWPAERFLSVARHLRARGLSPLFIGGPRDDCRPFEEFAVQRGAPLRQVMSLLRGAALFVGNDSGPAHVAAAFGIPVVVLFGPSDPVVWAPWRTTAEVLVAGGPAHQIPLDRVVEALDRLLRVAAS